MKLNETDQAINLLQRWQQGKINQTIEKGVWHDWTPSSDISLRCLNRHRAKPEAQEVTVTVKTITTGKDQSILWGEQPTKIITDPDWQECYPSRVAFWICTSAGLGICAATAAGLGFLLGILTK